MSRLLILTAAEMPNSVYRSIGGEIFVDATVASDLMDRAESEGVAVLGLEGFLIDESSGAIYPSLERIADFSFIVEDDRARFVRRTCAEARAKLNQRKEPPRPGGSMHIGARGRHMLAVVLDDS
jgi:hypothetical protein